MTRSLLDRDVSLNYDESTQPRRSASVSSVRPADSNNPQLSYGLTGGFLGSKIPKEFPNDEDRIFFPTNNFIPIGQSRIRSNLQSAPSSQQGHLITPEFYANNSNKIDPNLLQKRIEKKKELENIYSVESNIKKMLIPTNSNTVQQPKKRPTRHSRSNSNSSSKTGGLPRLTPQTPIWGAERDFKRSPSRASPTPSSNQMIFHASIQSSPQRTQSQMEQRNLVIHPSIPTHAFDDDDIDFENDFRDSSSIKEKDLDKKDSFDFEEQEFEISLSEPQNNLISNNGYHTQLSNHSSQFSHVEKRRSIGSLSSFKSAAPTVSPVQQVHRISMKKNQLEFLEKSLDLKKRQESQLDLAIRIQKRQLQLLRRKLKIHQDKEAEAKTAMERYLSMGDPTDMLKKIDEANKLLESKELRLQSLAKDLQDVEKMSEEKQHHLSNLEYSLKSDIDAIKNQLSQLKEFEKNVKKKQRETNAKEQKVKSLEEQLQARLDVNEKKFKEISLLEDKLNNENKMNKEKEQKLKSLEESLLQEKEQIYTRQEALLSATEAFQKEQRQNETLQFDKWEEIKLLQNDLTNREKFFEELLGIREEDKNVYGDDIFEKKIKELNSRAKLPISNLIDKSIQFKMEEFITSQYIQTDNQYIENINNELDNLKKIIESLNKENNQLKNALSENESQLNILKNAASSNPTDLKNSSITYQNELLAIHDAALTSKDKNSDKIIAQVNEELQYFNKADKLEKDLLSLQIQHQNEFEKIKSLVASNGPIPEESIERLNSVSNSMNELGNQYELLSKDVNQKVIELEKLYSENPSPVVASLLEKRKAFAQKIGSMRNLINNIQERDKDEINQLSSEELNNLKQNISNQSNIGNESTIQDLIKNLEEFGSRESNQMSKEIQSLIDDSKKIINFKREILKVEEDGRKSAREKFNDIKLSEQKLTDTFRLLSQDSVQSKMNDLDNNVTSITQKMNDLIRSNSILSPHILDEYNNLQVFKNNLIENLNSISNDKDQSNPEKNTVRELLQDVIKKIDLLENNENSFYKNVSDRMNTIKSNAQDILQAQKQRLKEKAILENERMTNDASYSENIQKLDKLWDAFRNNQIYEMEKIHQDFSKEINQLESEWNEQNSLNSKNQEAVINQYKNKVQKIEEETNLKLETLSKNKSLSPKEKQLGKIEILQEKQKLLIDAENEKLSQLKTLTNQALESVNQLDIKKVKAQEKLNIKFDELEKEKIEKIKALLELENKFENEYSSKTRDIATKDKELDESILKRISELEKNQAVIEQDRLKMHHQLENEIIALQNEIRTRPAIRSLIPEASSLSQDSLFNSANAQIGIRNSHSNTVPQPEQQAQESLTMPEPISKEDLIEVIASTLYSSSKLDNLSKSFQNMIDKKSDSTKENSNNSPIIENDKSTPSFEEFKSQIINLEKFDQNIIKKAQNAREQTELLHKKLEQIQEEDKKREIQYKEELEKLKNENKKKLEEAQDAIKKYEELELQLAKSREDASVVEAGIQNFTNMKHEYEKQVEELKTDLIKQQEKEKLIEKQKEELNNEIQLEKDKIQKLEAEVQNLKEYENAKETLLQEMKNEKDKVQNLHEEIKKYKQREETRKQIDSSVEDFIKQKEELQERELKLLQEEKNLSTRIENQNELVSRYESKMREDQEELNEKLQNLAMREQELELIYSKLTARLNDIRTDPENNFLPIAKSLPSEISMGIATSVEKRIIYLSQMVSITDCEAILSDSAQYNRENNITGILVCSDNAFIHLIEGRSKDVDLLYRKIIQDRRHQDIHCIRIEDDIPYRLCNSPMRIVKTSTSLLSTGNDLNSFTSSPSQSRGKSPAKISNSLTSPIQSSKLSPSRFGREEGFTSQPLLQLFDAIITSLRYIEKYAPPAVINMSKSNVNPLILPIQQRERIVMLVDIIKFMVKPRQDEVKSLMAKYFSITRKCVTKYHGDVLQYTGNSVIAVFETDHANEALKSVLLLYKTILSKIPLDNTNRNASLIQLGVVLTQGEVLEGSFGCGAQMSYQIVGEHVQRAWQIASNLHKQRYLFVFDNSIRAGLKKQESLFDQQVKHVSTVQIQNNRQIELYSIPSKSILLNPNVSSQNLIEE